MSQAGHRFGVLLMTYGSPDSLDDVERYITAVRGGRPPNTELIAEFRRRYAVIGGSPLIEITRAQAAALEASLRGRALVRAAMRFSTPTVAEALGEMAGADVTHAVAIILSPQFSPLLMGGYRKAVEAAMAQIGPRAPAVTLAGAWHLEPLFVEALAEHIRAGLARLPGGAAGPVPVLLTAHSLPRRVAEQEPSYLERAARYGSSCGRPCRTGPGSVAVLLAECRP